ncbi:MAG: TrmH family RNA methyltransferase [Acidimicrobiales bacterium]
MELSFTHQRVKRVRQLLRKRNLRWSERCLVVEGAELLSVALAAGAIVESVYIAPDGRSNPSVSEAVGRAFDGGARVFDLAPGVVERVADTVTPQPVLAVVGFSPGSVEAMAGSSMALVCSDIRDPGNAGTMIRTADASGVEFVVCCDGTVDPTNPKTVRASAGSVFHLPIILGGDVLAVLGDLQKLGYSTVGAVVRGGIEYTAFDWTAPAALVLGNEARGLREDVLASLDAQVSIAMAGRAESLNVSASAAILCFEALRQRRAAAAGTERSTMAGMDGSPADGSGSCGGSRS